MDILTFMHTFLLFRSQLRTFKLSTQNIYIKCKISMCLRTTAQEEYPESGTTLQVYFNLTFSSALTESARQIWEFVHVQIDVKQARRD